MFFVFLFLFLSPTENVIGKITKITENEVLPYLHITPERKVKEFQIFGFEEASQYMNINT